MPIEILMPALSPTMTEGNLAKWLKKEGDQVQAGDVIAEIETDKATMEVEAVDEGVMGKILVPAGTEGVAVNKLIAVLLAEGEDKSSLDDFIKSHAKAANDSKPTAKAEEITEEKAANNNIAAPQGTFIAPQATKAPPMPKDALITHNDGSLKASPIAKRLAADAGINLQSISGSGPRGRIVKEDVEAAIAGTGGKTARKPQEFFHVPNNTMRKVIAKRLTESKQQVPHFYLTVDCKIDKLLDVRKDLNDAAPTLEDGKPAYKISVNDMIIKAVALSLRDHPTANASWYDDAVVQYTNVDVSVAVAIDGGLITPIVKNADQLSLPAISNKMKDLANRARKSALAPEEFQGGGFTVSNLGMYGIKTFSAIINPPQSCILAVGAGEQQPVIEDGKVTVATVMEVTLSVDHRVVDGALGAELLQSFKSYIEKPVTMLV